MAIYDEAGKEIHSISRRIGRATNNEAEYQAAIAALEAAVAMGAQKVELRMDSELIVRQLEFRYRVRNARLKHLFGRLVDRRRRFSAFQVSAIPRAQNRRADELANLALDRGLD